VRFALGAAWAALHLKERVMSVYTVAKTGKSKPVAYFDSYTAAHAYNKKFYGGRYVVSEELVFVSVY